MAKDELHAGHSNPQEAVACLLKTSQEKYRQHISYREVEAPLAPTRFDHNVGASQANHYHPIYTHVNPTEHVSNASSSRVSTGFNQTIGASIASQTPDRFTVGFNQAFGESLPDTQVPNGNVVGLNQTFGASVPATQVPNGNFSYGVHSSWDSAAIAQQITNPLPQSNIYRSDGMPGNSFGTFLPEYHDDMPGNSFGTFLPEYHDDMPGNSFETFLPNNYSPEVEQNFDAQLNGDDLSLFLPPEEEVVLDQGFYDNIYAQFNPSDLCPDCRSPYHQCLCFGIPGMPTDPVAPILQ